MSEKDIEKCQYQIEKKTDVFKVVVLKAAHVKDPVNSRDKGYSDIVTGMELVRDSL